MPLYEQHVDGVKIARAFTVDGSEDDARHAALAASGAGGWQAVDVDGGGNHGPAPSTPAEPGRRPPQSAPKQAWVAWAAFHGMDAEQADDLTKAELIELADQLAKE